MEVLVENPGFRHLAIKIFQNLDFESLQKCLQVNSTWYEVIQDQRFAWILQLHKMKKYLNSIAFFIRAIILVK